MSHARLAPSSAHRWLTCPGSIEQSAGFPNRTTDASELGTVCHMLSEMRLNEYRGTRYTEPWDSLSVVEIEDQSVGGGVLKAIPVTEEMREWVRTATDWVITQLGQREGRLETEIRLNPGSYFGVPDECWGTADVLIDFPDELVIADFKYGTGHVEEDENPQLTLYAIGAAQRYGWKHAQYRLVILQPRTGTGEARDELLSRVELMRRAEEMRAGVIAATKPGAPLVASDEGCRWCPAAGRCAKLQERGMELAMRQFADPRFITESEMLLLLSEAKRIRIGLDAVEDYAFQRLSTGLTVPGWKRVRARANREWADEQKAAQELTTYGVQPYEQKLISPAQAEKRLGKMAGLLEPFITKREGAPTLAPESDRRPALPADV